MNLTPALKAEYKFLKNEVRKREAEEAVQELWVARKELKEFRLERQREGYKT